jgi:hypothetical protein
MRGSGGAISKYRRHIRKSFGDLEVAAPKGRPAKDRACRHKREW